MNLNSHQTIVIKYGGNAMTEPETRKALIKELAAIQKEKKVSLIVVHGGGPFIDQALKTAGIESSFIQGHRVTNEQAIHVVEQTLKGEVNAQLVSDFLACGVSAVGLSGKDGSIAISKPRTILDEEGNETSLGWVGDVVKVNEKLLLLLLENDFLPVIACLGTDEKGNTYNINADMLAGAIAGSLKAHYFTLTNVNGLYQDIKNPESKINEISLTELNQYAHVIQGGMIPKVEGCKIALEKGALSARMLNGTQPDLLAEVLSNPERKIGTQILK